MLGSAFWDAVGGILAILAFILSIIALLLQHATSKRLAEIDYARRDEELEMRRKADVRVRGLRVERPGTGMTNEEQRLTLHNRGAAAAQEVRVAQQTVIDPGSLVADEHEPSLSRAVKIVKPADPNAKDPVAAGMDRVYCEFKDVISEIPPQGEREVQLFRAEHRATHAETPILVSWVDGLGPHEEEQVIMVSDK